ncbi:MAG: HepT-like ribonuclease domain-containing protein [Pelovirga sp.]
MPTIEWRSIKDFRNFIVHEYFGIDSRIVWDAVQLELPLLKKGIASLRESID